MKKVYYVIILLLIYVVTLSVRMHWLSQKDGLYLDEGLSIAISCYNEYMWAANYPFNESHSGAHIREISLCDNDSLMNVASDVAHLWIDNRDPPHTNFYYSLLRISLAGLKTGNVKEIIMRAGILNLVFFTISFFMFFALMNLFFRDDMAIPFIGTFCAFMSTGTISNTLFLRPYQLQETFFIVFVYFLFRFIGMPKTTLLDKKIFIRPAFVLGMSFVTALTLLTGYYSVFFIGMFGAYVIYYHVKTKSSQEILAYVIVLTCAVLLAQFCYSRYITGFLSYRVTETPGTIFGDGVLDNLGTSLRFILVILTKHYFSIAALIVIALSMAYLFVSKRKFTFPESETFVFLITVMYIIIVTFIAPMKELRYSVVAFPFLILLPLLLFRLIENRFIYYVAVSALCLTFILNAFDEDNIENLFKDKPENYKFVENPEVPVLVLNKSYWKYADLVPYFHDKQQYIFNDKFDNLVELDGYKEFYLVVEKSMLEDENINIVAQQFEVESVFEVNHFSCMKIKGK